MLGILFLKLLVIFVVVAIGWAIGRLKWLGENDVSRTLGNAAYYIFIPALLFRTMARLDTTQLPWTILAAFFAPATVLLLVIYFWQQYRSVKRPTLAVTAPAVRALSSTFGSSVQVGLPMMVALFGELGLSIHLAIIGLHSLILMSLATALAENLIARQRKQDGSTDSAWRALTITVRSTLIHPVVLPILSGLAWQHLFDGLPALADEILLTMSQAVIPLCLVLIGLSLAQFGIRGVLKNSLYPVIFKLLVLPAAVLTVAHWGLGLKAMPLSVVVLAAALPIGANVLFFSQRYKALEAETASSVVLSTLCFMLSAPLWLAVLSLIK